MKPLLLFNRPVIQQLTYSVWCLVIGLFSHSVLAQTGGIYSTPGLYTYTVPAGGPYQIRVTARGGDGGGFGVCSGGRGGSVASTYTVQSGNVLTLIVGQNGFFATKTGGGANSNTGGGGGGGGSAVVITRNGTRTLLVAAGGGGGGGGGNGTNSYPGGGGQGIGSANPGAGGPEGLVYSSGGGGGGFQGPGGNGSKSKAGDLPGGTGGDAASLSAVSAGGTYTHSFTNNPKVDGGSGFGGGGAAGGFDQRFPAVAGGGGGSYGGGQGAKSGPQSYENQADPNDPIYTATGGFSNINASGTNNTVTPGIKGGSQNDDGLVSISFINNSITAAFTTPTPSICQGFSTILEGTVSATGNWTLVLSDGSTETGSGSTFSIPVSPVISTTYTIQSLTDDRGLFANAGSLTSRATVTVNPPTVTLTNNGPMTCSQSVTLTAAGGTSYTFSSGNTILPGDPASNTRIVTSPGIYTVTAGGVSGATNSCPSSATTAVVQTQAPPTLTFTNDGPLTCAKTTVRLNAVSDGLFYKFYGPSGLSEVCNICNYSFTTSPGTYTVVVTGRNGCTTTATTTVTQSTNPPTVGLTNNGPLGCGRPAVTLTASGGTSYTFSSGNTVLAGDPASNTRVVNQPGTYTVRVQAAEGCVGSTTTVVLQSQQPLPTINLTNNGPLSCTLTSVTLTASGGTSYTFSNGTTILPGDPASTTRVVSSTGVYTVIASGANGCTNSATTTVTQLDTSPTISLTNNGPFTCAQTSVTLTAAGGTSYTFTSQGNVLPGERTSNTRVVNRTGDYVVRVANANGCINTTSTTVEERLGTPPDVRLINADGGPLTCLQKTVTLAAILETVSTSIVSYTFSRENVILPGDPTSNSREVSQPGQYIVRVTGANGCTNVAGVYVYLQESFPVVYLDNNGPFTCNRIDVTLTAVGTSGIQYYKFIYPNGYEELSGRNFTFVYSPGSYTVVGINPDGCTSAPATTTVGNNKPPVSLVNSGPLSCAQTSVTLTASGGSSYTFYNGDTVLEGDPASNTRVVTSPGDYRVVAVVGSRCTNSAATTVERGTDTSSPAVRLVNNGPLSCTQTSVTLTASGGTSYTFTSGRTVLGGDPASNTRVVTSTGEYSVRGSADGCANSASTTTVVSRSDAPILVSNPAPASLLVNQVIDKTFTATAGIPPYSFSVASGSLPTGLSLSTDGHLRGTITQAGSFTAVIQATDVNGCTGLSTPYVMDVLLLTITSQPPASLTTCPGIPVSVSVSVEGATTTYQWYKDNIPVPGQASAALSLASVSSTDAGRYVAVVTSGALSLTSTAFTLTVLSSVAPARLYVNASATGANTGLDWANAYTDLQSALTTFSCTNTLKEIWVAQGIYKPTTTGDRLIAFKMLPGVAIYGGFVGNETALSQRPSVNPVSGRPSSSILSGNIGQAGENSDNTLAIVLNSTNLDPTAVLDGFVITDGNFAGYSNSPGGSLINSVSDGASSPTLTNLHFINNSGGAGGAIYNAANCRPAISNCLFQNNTAQLGGAIVIIEDLTLSNCSFQNNSAASGGAILNTGNLVLTNCSFQDNSATTEGGAVFNVMTGNGDVNSVLTNCSFQGNSAPVGGAIYNSDSFNGAPPSGNVRLSIANSVFFNNGGAKSIGNSGDATTSASYSFFELSVTGYASVGSPTGSGNLTATASPFASPSGTQLAATSPAINAGSNGAYQTVNGPSTDLAGNARIQQTTIDMGAYESNSQTPPCTTPLASILVPNGGVLSCAQPGLSLTATGGDSYRWDDNSTSALRIVTNAGTYSVTVTNASGCSASATTTITSTTALITLTSPGQTTATVGELFSQSFTASGGNSPYSFSIVSGSLPSGLSLSGEGVLSGTLTQTGSFTLSVQARDAGGCIGVSSSAYTLLIRDVVATPTLSLANVSVSPASVCVGSSVTVTATVANATGSYAYTLTNGSSTTTGSSSDPAFSQTLIASGSGVQTFTLTVSSAGQSARATTTLTVNPLPVPTLSASNGGLLTCGQTSLTLTAGGGTTYAFSGPGVVSQTGNTALVNVSGTYSVTVTNTETGCFSTTTTTVSSSTDTPSISISASSTTLSCASPSASLTVVGTGSVRWSTGSTDPVISVNTAGTYSVTLTSPGGCTATASATVEQQAEQPLAFSQQPASGTSVTVGATVTASVTVSGSPIAYQWFKNNGNTPISGQTTATLTLTSVQLTDAGSYYVVVTGGCPSGVPTSLTSNAFSLSVTEPVQPGSPFAITAVTTLSCTPVANRFTVSFTPRYSGLDGSPVSFQVANELLPTTEPGPYSLQLYADNPIVTLGAQQSGVTSSFAYNWLAACGSTTPPPPTQPFAIMGVTTLSCTPVGDRVNISFAPRYEGLNGQPVSFAVVNELLPTTEPAPYSLTLYRDNPVLELRATQGGSASPATFSYNWLASCASQQPDNTPPRINSAVASQTAVVDQAFSLDLAGTFLDQETPGQLTLSASGLPAGLNLAGTTISGTASASGITTVTITATDPGSLSVSTSFTLTVIPAGVEPPTTAVFSISGVQTVSCEVVNAGLRKVTFTPQYTGTSGQPIRFSVVNEMDETTAPGPYTLNLYTDNPTITLKASQTGSAGEATYAYNWLAGCTAPARLGSGEATSRLAVRILGNPVEGNTAEVEIRGVSGQAVQLTLVDLQGKLVHTHQIEQAEAVERVSLPTGNSSGVLLLQVSTSTQNQQVKLVKP